MVADFSVINVGLDDKVTAAVFGNLIFQINRLDFASES